MNNVISPISPTNRFRRKSCHLILFLSFLVIQACAKYTYHDEPINYTNVTNEINSWSIHDSGLNQFLIANGLPAENLRSNLFSIKRLYLTGLYYDPEMQLAYEKWKKAKIDVDRSSYNINPELSIPFEHHSDTSDGQSEWTIGAVLSFIYERKSKREAKRAKAEVTLLNAALEISRLAFERYGLFEDRYHSYLIRQAEISEVRNEIKTLKALLGQLQKKYELGGVSLFELNTIKLELQRGLFQLSVQENKSQENEDELLAMTHLTYSELDVVKIEMIEPLMFAKSTYQDSVFSAVDMYRLQRTMLDNHLDMALQLNQYAQSEAELRLKIESQYPDLVLSPGFIFDQTDNIWALGSSWVLPLFKNAQQNIDILKALRERKIKQQEVLVLQKQLLNLLYKMHRSVLRHKQSIDFSDDIIRSIENRAKEIETQIKIGGIDQTALLRNRIELHKAKQEQIHIYQEAIDAILELEHLLRSSHTNIHINDVITKWLEQVEERGNDELVN